jgi:hypothetical protein
MDLLNYNNYRIKFANNTPIYAISGLRADGDFLPYDAQ